MFWYLGVLGSEFRLFLEIVNVPTNDFQIPTNQPRASTPNQLLYQVLVFGTTIPLPWFPRPCTRQLGIVSFSRSLLKLLKLASSKPVSPASPVLSMEMTIKAFVHSSSLAFLFLPDPGAS